MTELTRDTDRIEPGCPLLALSGHGLLRCMSPLLTQSGYRRVPANARLWRKIGHSQLEGVLQ